MSDGYLRVMGMKDVKAKLRQLGSTEAKRISRKALRDGAKILKAEVISLAPESDKDHKDKKYESRTHQHGYLKKNIRLKAGVRKNGAVRFIVGLGRKAMYYGYYASFYLLGHKGWNGKNFFKDAYDHKKDEVVAQVHDGYLELLDP